MKQDNQRYLSMKKYILIIFILVLLIPGLFLFSKWKKGVTEQEYQAAISRNMSIYALEIPENAEFAGEAVPMDLYYVRESFDRELLTNVYWHSSTLLMFKRAHRFLPQIEKILEKEGMPDDMKYIALIESSLTNTQSPAGASGPWQFMKAAALKYGLEVNEEVDERYHMKKSTEAACRYLKDSYQSFGNWTLAAASYNAGPGNISKPVSTQNENSFYDLLVNAETSRYIYRILAVKEIFNNPVKYGFNFRKKDLYPEIPVKEIMVDSTIPNLAEFAKKQGINYKILKEFNPWLRKNTLTNKTKKKYYLDIPERNNLYYSKLKTISDTSNEKP
jgi:membrane-bound lytic murein transglycosylase D